MTQKRKAELQRKLSMTSVPRPPDGLADRIKADIPDLRATKNERERLSRSVVFNMRVAASILVLISSAFLALRLLSPAVEEGLVSRVQPEAMVTVTIEPQASESALQATDSVAAYPQSTNMPTSVPRIAALDRRETDEERQSVRPELRKKRSESANELQDFGSDGGVVGGVASAPPPPPPPPAAPSVAPPVAAPAAPAPVEVAATARDAKSADVYAGAPPAREVVSEAITVTSQAPSLVMSARAANFSLAAPSALFGVSLNRSEFNRLRTMIESSERPDPASVDVEALVNHFAGVRTTRDDVSLQIEASQPPLPGGAGLLRVTIDTAAAPAGGGSLPPVATAATLDIDVKSDVVDRYTIVGSGKLSSTEPVLVKGTSMTRLVELTVSPDARPSQVVATIQLRYGSVRTGKAVTVTKNVLARDVRRAWTAASRRHRLATLGAIWGESLTDTGRALDVARTAEKLSEEKPEDERARELAKAATASSRLRSSGPTGSGR
jgi:hypothetical protein